MSFLEQEERMHNSVMHSTRQEQKNNNNKFQKRYSCYETFVRSIRAKETRDKYIWTLGKFLTFCNFSKYEQLLEEMQDTDKFQAVKEFLIYLESERDMSPRSIHIYYSSIKLFFDVNNVLLNWKLLSKHKPSQVNKYDDRIYTDEEIRQLIEFSDIRERVLILTLISTGMRVGGLAELKVKDLEFLEDYNIYKFKVYSEDIGERYITFCTPECANAIRLYLKSREEWGETITGESPLIGNKVNQDIRLLSKNKNMEDNLASRTLQAIVTRLQRKSHIFKIRKEKDISERGRFRKPVMRCHSFRKIFNTKCIENGINLVVKEKLLGHRVSIGLDIHYYRPTDKQLLEEYLKIVDAVTVSEENRLRKRVVELEFEAKRLDSAIADIQLMKEKFEKSGIKI